LNDAEALRRDLARQGLASLTDIQESILAPRLSDVDRES